MAELGHSGPGETPYPAQELAPEAALEPQGEAPARYDCAIVGGGPAGLSAAIYVARYNRTALVVDFGEGRSTSHETNENYLGFPDGVTARDLRELGQKQASRFGVRFLESKVDQIDRDGDEFLLLCDEREVRARTVILATGVVDIFPDFPDVEGYVGKSLFWCITCDGYKARGKRVAVVGKDDEAATTCMQFLNFTDRLTFITNCTQDGCKLTSKGRGRLERAGIPIFESPIADVNGADGVLRAIRLEDGQCVETDMMFNQQGCRPNSQLAASLGAETEEEYIKVDEEQRTNIPRLFAAGDVTKMLSHQIVTAAHEGATAGETANYELYRPEQRID